MVHENLGQFPKKSPHFKEIFNEIINFFGIFGQISCFLILRPPYLVNRF
jgi:hypothetical protein